MNDKMMHGSWREECECDRLIADSTKCAVVNAGIATVNLLLALADALGITRFADWLEPRCPEVPTVGDVIRRVIRRRSER